MPVALALALLFASPPPRQEGERLFNAGTKAYRAGHYEEALADFAASYEALPLGQVLFDLAQCDRKLGRWDEAEKQYQRFLAAMPKAPNREEVVGYLKRVRAERAKAKAVAESALPPVAPPPPAQPAPSSPPAWPPEQPRSVEALKLEPPPPAAPMAAVEAPAPAKHQSSGPYWLGGSGVLVALAGGACVIAGEVMAGGDTTHTAGGATYHSLTPATVTSINNLLAASYVLFGVGAAALVGAGAWAVAAPASSSP